MNTTKSETSAHPLAVTIEVDGEAWQWIEVRQGVMWAAASTGAEIEALSIARERISRAASGPRTAPRVRVNGRPVFVSSMGATLYRDGGAEFTFRWVEVTPPAVTPPAVPTFRYEIEGRMLRDEPWTPAKVLRHVREEMPEVQAVLDRRAREAPLVALVAAVPEGLDPVGWRAAVLAAVEADGPDRAMSWMASTLPSVLRKAQEDDPRLGFGRKLTPFVDAYRRAMAPQGPRPVPERRIGGRAVRLVVDNGEG